MSTATKAVQAARFLGGMYRERARVLYWAHVRHDLLSRAQPDPTGTPIRTRSTRKCGRAAPCCLRGLATTAPRATRLCNEVLRSRKFGPTPTTEAKT